VSLHARAHTRVSALLFRVWFKGLVLRAHTGVSALIRSLFRVSFEGLVLRAHIGVSALVRSLVRVWFSVTKVLSWMWLLNPKP